MSLSGIFDPMVRAYFNGCGSGVDDGYCIVWDGNTEGRAFIDLVEIKLYKVSNAVLSKEKLIGATTIYGEGEVVIGTEYVPIATSDGLCSAFVNGSPWIISGLAGTYNYFDALDVHVPEDGTYFLSVPDVLYCGIVYNSATA